MKAEAAPSQHTGALLSPSRNGTTGRGRGRPRVELRREQWDAADAGQRDGPTREAERHPEPDVLRGNVARLSRQ
jgi:hypothetical protein